MRQSKKTYTQFGRVLIDLDFFHSKLQEDASTGCLNWTGAGHRQGYGMVGIRHTEMPRRLMTVAHRVAMIAHLGRELAYEEYVIHTCGNNRCCNPAHLFVGTAHDKTRIMDINGRRIPPNPLVKQRRIYKYTEEELNFLRVATISEIVARFRLDSRARASNIRFAAKRHYKWLKQYEQENADKT